MFYLGHGIKPLCTWDNRVTLRYIRITGSAGKELRSVKDHGFQRQTGRYLLRRPVPGGGERAGWDPAGADRPERYGQPPFPHGHRRRHHQPDGQGTAPHTYQHRRRERGPVPGLGDPPGADQDHRQAPPAGAHGQAGRKTDAAGGRRHQGQFRPAGFKVK